MGLYINKGNVGFVKYTSGEYIDKTGMIAYINSTLNTANQLTCVTRPRRFGKSIAAHMLCAYYDRSCDSAELFDRFEIAGDPSYKEHLNRYPVVFVDITKLTTRYEGREDIVDILENKVIEDVKNAYPDIEYNQDADLMETLQAIVQHTGEKFIFIIDEWDAMCRELADRPKQMNGYVNLLRRMFKSADTPFVFAGVYMTGILPIKKYGTQSALNDFREYSMTTPGAMGGFFGFTDSEVKALAIKHHMDFDELKRWYDGYEMETFDWRLDAPEVGKTPIYNPNSVMTALRTRRCRNYWSMTESFEALQQYIDCDFEGVRETLESLVKNVPVPVKVLRFGNDISSIRDNDELFTLLIHFGYLSYDPDLQEAVLPNQEIREEFIEALRGSRSHKELSQLVRRSDQLLKALWMEDAEAVAEGMEYIHNHDVAPRFYNNEQALRAVVRTALLGAIDHYIEIQELPTGKGFADLVFIPRSRSGHPALVVELKWNAAVHTAIDQIRERDYPAVLRPLATDILLVGITYDPDTKHHTCCIERVIKDA